MAIVKKGSYAKIFISVKYVKKLVVKLHKECNIFNQYQKCNFLNYSYKHVKVPTNEDFKELFKRVFVIENNNNIPKTIEIYKC